MIEEQEIDSLHRALSRLAFRSTGDWYERNWRKLSSIAIPGYDLEGLEKGDLFQAGLLVGNCRAMLDRRNGIYGCFVAKMQELSRSAGEYVSCYEEHGFDFLTSRQLARLRLLADEQKAVAECRELRRRIQSVFSQIEERMFQRIKGLPIKQQNLLWAGYVRGQSSCLYQDDGEFIPYSHQRRTYALGITLLTLYPVVGKRITNTTELHEAVAKTDKSGAFVQDRKLRLWDSDYRSVQNYCLDIELSLKSRGRPRKNTQI